MGQTYSLDRTDCKLLALLDRDARLSASELARRLTLGRDLVSYRLERFEKRGILKRCTVLIDPYTLGYAIYRTFVKLENVPKKTEALWKHLAQHPRVFWMAECHGSCDLMFSVLAQTPHEFNITQSEIFSQFNPVILDYKVHTISSFKAFYKQYFGVGGGGFSSVGYHSRRYTLSDLESRIITILSRNARTEFSEISEQTGSAPATVKARIEALQAAGVIAGFRAEINPLKLGLTTFLATIYVRSFKLADFQKLAAYCEQQPQITYFIRHIGASPVEIEIEANDYEGFAAVMSELREQHAAFFRDSEIALIRRSHHSDVLNLQ